MWAFIALFFYGVSGAITDRFPNGNDWSAFAYPLAQSVSWIKANDKVFPAALILLIFGTSLSWLVFEISLMIATLAVKIKSFAIRAVSMKS
jgi:hypothetical protein